MSVEQNKQMAKDFIAALGNSDIDRIKAMLTDDAGYWICGKPDLFPMAGTKSKADFVKMMEGAKGAFKDGLAMISGGITGEGDRVALEVESKGMAPTGKLYNNTYHFLFTFRGGKIAGVKEYMDTQHAAHVFSP